MVFILEKRGLLVCYYSLLTLCMLIFVVTTFLPPQVKRMQRSREESLGKLVTQQVFKSMNATPRQDNMESTVFGLFRKEFKGKRVIKIGLLNMEDEEEEEEHISMWRNLGKTSRVHFHAVSGQDFSWEDLFIRGDHKSSSSQSKGPVIPMPSFEELDKFDVVVLRTPCSRKGVGEIRDVMRLQANLIAASLMVRSGWGRTDHTVLAVFVGSSCRPMWEIFRCDDLVMNGEGIRIYRPDLRRLEQKLLLLAGSCDSILPVGKHSEPDGKMNYNEISTKLQNNAMDDPRRPREAYATVLHSSESYVCGAIALAQSILLTNSFKDLVLLADKTITRSSRKALEAAGWKIKHLERIRCPTAKKGAYNEWNYSKLQLWNLTEYDKVIFIDSDLIVLKNMDRFFASPQLSAARNNRMIFNSGVMLIEPSKCMYDMMMEMKDELVSYNGGDQGFLNEVFTMWHPWPQEVNYLKIFHTETRREVLPETYTIHYLGLKPWTCYRDYDCNWDMKDHQKFASDIAHRRWWQLHDTIPRELQEFCDLSQAMESKLSRARETAAKGNFSDNHWKIRVKDPRQHLSSSSSSSSKPSKFETRH